MGGYPRRIDRGIWTDAFKSFLHQGLDPRFSFYRDQGKQEVNLIYERANLARLWEIKSTYTFRPRLIDTVEKVASYWDRPTETYLIYAGEEAQRFRKTQLLNWRDMEWGR